MINLLGVNSYLTVALLEKALAVGNIAGRTINSTRQAIRATHVEQRAVQVEVAARLNAYITDFDLAQRSLADGN